MSNQGIPTSIPFAAVHHAAIYQYLTVAANTLDQEIYRITNPNQKDHLGVIIFIANSWFPNTTLRWFVDDTLLQTIQYQIAQINSPLKYAIGIPFYKNIYWHADNNDGNAHTFEVLQDGYYIRKVPGLPVPSAGGGLIPGTG